ncbi:LAME_0A00474g1_1 [Lachancea meyersii CBS 8951]|uniref:LAME_0A00474g1_1 n=1 Tax=Lachancea meyersii CBS 8951 TaxID=1266667 RepID=A0A1G4ILL6_9SACH|nr:LAME_0A00474g1_1 [Lachancea meyersii CBS 8951]
MYIPKLMEVNDFSKQADIIRSNPLGIIFSYAMPQNGFMGFIKGNETSAVDSEMCATHVPFVLVKEKNGKTKLVAHLAAKNQHIQMLEKYSKCMVVFQSVDSYVSPSWYPLKKKTHKYVPTWDFATVHVYGAAKIIRDKTWLLNMLGQLTDQEENKRPDGDEFEEKWKVSDAPEKYVDTLLNGIVGLEIDVTDIQSKFKLHQNEAAVNVKGVLEGYEKEIGGCKTQELAKLTKENHPHSI